jgi:hypothetical protein
MRLVRAPLVAIAVLASPATALAGSSAPPGRYYQPVRSDNPGMGAFTAAAAKVITYGGATSQDSPVVVQLSRDRKRVASTGVHWEAACASGMSVTYGGTLKPTGPAPAVIPPDTHFFTPKPVSKSGSFSGSSVGNLDFNTHQGNVTQEVRGKLGAKKGSGTWHAHVDVIEKATGNKVDDCDTGALKWSAPGPQDLVYGGATSAGEPFVLIMRKDRKEVAELRIGWSAPCDPSGFFQIGDDLVRFPTSRTGAFGDVFTQTFPADGGGTNVFDYSIAGKVGKTKASGTFQVKLTRKDSAGTVTQTCDQGTVRFSARQ